MKSTRQKVMATALLALGLGPHAPLIAAEGERLTGGDITEALRGATLVGVYNDGRDSAYRETYNADGTIAYHDEENGDLKGVWGVNANTFCTYYDGIPGTCFQVRASGANCFFFVAVDVADRPPRPNDWTARGWKDGVPSTCD